MFAFLFIYYVLVNRWIKFEEDVEEGGNRWSKPHVATLSLHSLFELRSLLLNGTVMLDMEATSLEQIADLILDNMVNAGSLTSELKDKVTFQEINMPNFTSSRVCDKDYLLNRSGKPCSVDIDISTRDAKKTVHPTCRDYPSLGH